MREILFRGKRIDNGEWVDGSLFVDDKKDKHEILVGYVNYRIGWGVDPKTVGQYTGLNDANGKKIFEGDIFPIEDEIVALVIFDAGGFRLEEYGLCGSWTESGFDECGGGWGVIECEPIDWYTIHQMEIIGNIHDNPKLIKGGAYDGK